MFIFAVISNVMSKYLKIQISIDDINIFSGCLIIIDLVLSTELIM